ncbi:GGDEF domain-containing protein [Fibrobacter succinogenes]|uniref:sensor domain-containing diguanylate cyclase n=1 Tax=Fibrobacter succinogenes TaxID=833 RepID=UPI0013D56069|nr:GGDEF domain-containing protein [Fibrobacter succinogenes]
MVEPDRIHKQYLWVTSVSTVVLILLFVVFLIAVRYNGVAPQSVRLDKGWTVTYKGEKTGVESLVNYTFPEKLMSGDSLILEGRISANPLSHPIFRFRTVHSAVEVFENGKSVYEYGKDRMFPGCGYHYVHLNHGEHQSLKVVLVEKIDNRKITFSKYELLPEEYSVSDYSSRHIFALVIGIFLILFGLLAVMVGAVMRIYGVNYFRLLMIGLLSFTFGTWTMCYTKLIQVVSYNLTFNTTLEYICLYFAPIPFTLLLWNMQKTRLSQAKTWVMKFLVAYEVAYLAVSSVLHFTGLLFYPQMLVFFHAVVFAGLVYFVYSGILYNKKMDESGKILSRGVLFFVVMVIADMLRYNFARHLAIDNPLLESSWIPLGTLGFVFSLVQSYVVYLVYILEDRAEKGALATMAYLDALTGLYNRAKCQQIFDILDKSFGDYAFVSIDMNGLKAVNDKYGHNEGDKLIKIFAGLFNEAFAGVGTAIRVGGDEFLAIVRSEHVADVNDAVKKMTDLQKERSEGLPISLEVAYGVAYKHEFLKNGFSMAEETHIDAEKVYHLSDERMYAMKAKMKSKLARL